MRLSCYLFLILLGCYSNHALAIDQAGVWGGVFSRKAIDPQWGLWTEFQARQNLTTHQMHQSLFRFGPTYKLSEKIELSLLYGLINTLGAYEHRMTEQVLINSLPFTTRFRLEQRTLEKINDINHRFRAMIRYDFLNKNHNNFVIWNELFLLINNTAWTQNTVFDRNRLFIGLRHRFENLAFEWGYMNQHIEIGTSSINEHILTLYLFY